MGRGLKLMLGFFTLGISYVHLQSFTLVNNTNNTLQLAFYHPARHKQLGKAVSLAAQQRYTDNTSQGVGPIRVVMQQNDHPLFDYEHNSFEMPLNGTATFEVIYSHDRVSQDIRVVDTTYGTPKLVTLKRGPDDDKRVWVTVKNEYFEPSITIRAYTRALGCIGIEETHRLVCNKGERIPYGKTRKVFAGGEGYGQPFSSESFQVFVKTDERGVYLTQEPVHNRQALVFRGTLGAQGKEGSGMVFNDFYYIDIFFLKKNPLPMPPAKNKEKKRTQAGFKKGTR